MVPFFYYGAAHIIILSLVDFVKRNKGKDSKPDLGEVFSSFFSPDVFRSSLKRY